MHMTRDLLAYPSTNVFTFYLKQKQANGKVLGMMASVSRYWDEFRIALERKGFDGSAQSNMEQQ